MRDDPLALFHEWQREARGEPRGLRAACRGAVRRLAWGLLGMDRPHPEAAALATLTPAGRPAVRFVLVKAASAEGFWFYTDTGSAKAAELEHLPFASLAFSWPMPPRQVRVEGPVTPLERAACEAYWRTKPRRFQLGTLASHQSAPLPARRELEERAAELRRTYQGQPVPCPERWGGYRLIPERLEFWEGRLDYLHTRVCFERGGGGWTNTLLQP